MENRSHAIIAATFLVVFALGAAAVYWWLHHGPPENRVYEIVTAQSVGGLGPRAAVKYKGLTIGHVRHVGFDPSNPDRVLIRFAVRPDARVTHATYARLALKGITGGQYLELAITPGGDRRALPTSARAPAQIPLHASLLQRLRSAGNRNLDRIDDIVANAQKLLSDKNRRHLSNAIAQIDSASRALVAIEQDLRPAARQLPELAKASHRLLQQADDLLVAARKPVASAQAMETSVTRLGNSSQQLVDRLNYRTLPQLEALIDHLEKTARHLDRLSAELTAQPQSLLFGAPRATPGPGEPGFDAKNKRGNR